MNISGYTSIIYIINIYNSIMDIDLQFNNGYSNISMDIHDPIMDIQNCMMGKIIDIHNWIMDVNIWLDNLYPN